jgi:BirA family transcriptional regulator, biotin operon repressor / biotin---[acetyl-CoA-carboxylase] ligase
MAATQPRDAHLTPGSDPLPPMAFEVLRRLEDGAFCSGEAMAEALEVSRGTIWNAIRALQASGLRIFKVRGRGYRLAEPFALLDAGAIRRASGAAAHRIDLDIRPWLGSTNTALLARSREGARDGTVLTCELQSQGRGRRGADWQAPLGAGLTFSILRRFTRASSGLAGLSLAVGVACARALERRGISGIALKWPNDLLIDRAKLGGILIEMQGDVLGPCAVVIGIGINVHLPAEIRARIEQPVTDLLEASGAPVDRNEVMGSIIEALVSVLDEFAERGFAAFRQEWLRRHAMQDHAVDVILDAERTLCGRAVDVGEDGALVIENASGRHFVHAGSVSLRATSARRQPS